MHVFSHLCWERAALPASTLYAAVAESGQADRPGTGGQTRARRCDCGHHRANGAAFLYSLPETSSEGTCCAGRALWAGGLHREGWASGAAK